MKIQLSHPWPETAAEAEAVQDALRASLDLAGPGPRRPAAVAGVDVAYAGDRLAAAVVVLDAVTHRVVEQVAVTGRTAFEYVPGLLAFRELPSLTEALERLTIVPDLVVCDGYGLAHPRRFGLACHLGVLTGLPTVGVGKTAFVGSHREPGRERGAWSDLVLDGDVVGRVLRTQDGVKPVFVSTGHRIDLETACRHVLALSPRYRLPETTRAADRLSRTALREAAGG
ncbi:endonuclease V [Planomonospora parontospora subsp. parontospora]|uniref:Endonuclease V n=2 Tax=Planomonospora parontospora TaxID=58119 RepID=A0AA37F795_9ACTN|nr:endonuclease V [Planomonospora parontospora]GGK87674.1 endonuclease V [Planomonospora parontospora]GII11379.1 endonuclease V [Planomonospora parontospora subsp. parontospora]